MPDSASSFASYYHERTKYHPDTIAAKNKVLDWGNQPSVFKEYKIGTIYDLQPYLSPSQGRDPDTESWERISRLLACSYGLTAKIATMGNPIYLRTAPSAGGLYPAEVYLISRGTKLLPAGLYSYQPLTHTLVHFWVSEVWTKLKEACFGHWALKHTNLALVTTAIFYRSAWRYEDRAYRRIFLDTGHLLGNIELASALYGYFPHLIGGFRDAAMNELFYLDSHQESVLTAIALTDLQATAFPPTEKKQTALPSPVHRNIPPVADGELLTQFHQATEIQEFKQDDESSELAPSSSGNDKYNFPFCLKISTLSPPIHWGKYLVELEKTILYRRSTRAYTGGNLTFDELKALLSFTYQPQDYESQNLPLNPDYFDLSLIQTFIAVSGVTGLEEGCYYYAPQAQELRQIRFKNFRKELHYLCLGQDLGRDASVVIFHTADLEQAVQKYGDRAYRYLHLDAGHLGQRLNLGAIQLGLGVSGIGGFFDDQVNEVLGIPEDEAVLYITTLGRPRLSN
ncbi:MAG: SagB/ThcOx family dehydrogenase [Snowella sp.]|nr:SagB/ThcOx family dehydrogenase [Snowella sp.]